MSKSGGLDAEDVVLCVIDEGVATVTLHRPERMNAWTRAMEQRYFALLDELERDPAVRVIVVTGAGRGFCPGLDVDDLSGAAAGTAARDNTETMLHALGIGKPMICAINGACAGIGLVQALACDVRFAAAGIKIATAFTRRGLVAEFGASWFLPRIIGHANALDLLLSGRTITAEEALNLGLVNRVVTPERLLDETVRYARDLAEHCSPAAMAAVKRQVYDDWLRTGLESEDEWRRLISQPHRKADFREGVASYLERRPPRFAPYTGEQPAT